VLAAILAGAGATAILAATAVDRRRRFAGVFALATFCVAAYGAGAAVVLPELDAIKSHRPFCARIVAEVDPRDPLHGYRLWRWRASYSFYSGRAIRSLGSPEELRAYWARPERVFLIVERGMLEEVRATIDPGPPLAERAVGHNHAYLFASRPEGARP
jgi:hypothetical protein